MNLPNNCLGLDRLSQQLTGLSVLILLAVSTAVGNAAAESQDTTHVPAIDLPPSSYLSPPAKQVLGREQAEFQAIGSAPCASGQAQNPAPPSTSEDCHVAAIRHSPFYQRMRERYPVDVKPQVLGGVPTETFTPTGGAALKNRHRVLLNLHGGGFTTGWHTFSDLEAIPIAAVAKITVISINYRHAPDNAFPAASEDVANVYRALLKTYRPKDIGFYGCSAGGLLAAQSVAWLRKEGLALPAAVGMFCSGAGYWTEGDSGFVGMKTIDDPVVWATSAENPYFRNTNPDDPLTFPIRSPELMSHFPPSLLITATRDPALSSTVQTHAVLVAQGAETELHVFEGMRHAFFYDADLPQSAEVYRIVARFFDQHWSPVPLSHTGATRPP
jgi:acetyl esterase/lipase